VFVPPPVLELAKDYVLEEQLAGNAERGVRQEDLLRAAARSGAI
jgi:hypothetical protein